MYSYVCLPPGEGVWPRLQTLAYPCPPAPLLLLPPIQTHSFCSRPAPRESHCFHAVGAALASAPPRWAFLPPPPGAASLGSSFPAAAAPAPPQPAPDAERRLQWPEGSSLQLQLRWGRVERSRGPPLALPDAVRRQLRRAYGTYPRTDVRVTRRGGQFLLRAAPRVAEPEYRVARRVLRRPAGGDGGDSGDSGDDSRAAVQGSRPKKKQGLR